jgi:hypothetical protein
MTLKMSCTTALVAAVASASGLALAADQTPIPLNYNFNGMVHTGEAGWPDNPDGFRSIADRGLLVDGNAGSLNAGPITGSTGLSYSIVGSPFVVDIVHLGNRLISNAYDAIEDGDNIGIQPNWDTSPDHTVPQVSDVSSLNLEMFGNTQLGVLYQISNSGGEFDMTLTFTDTSSVTVRLRGPDWFGTPAVPAPFAGVLSQTRLGGASALWSSTNSNDLGSTAPAGERLSVIEAVISVQDLIADGFGDITGKTLASITFGNATYPANVGRGYAIFAATIRGAENFGPEGVGSVSPNPVVSGQSATFSVSVTPGSGSPNNITGVEVDGTTLDLGAIVLNDSGMNGDLVPGDNIWSSTVSVPSTALAGPRNAQFTITDAQARTSNGNIAFNVIGQPAATDLGTLTDGTVSVQAELVSGGVVWYRFDLAQSVDAIDLEFLDIDTEGSVITGSDTEIGLYDGLGNRIANDDDDGSATLSQLSFGAPLPRPAVGTSVAYNGRDGATLAAGTYYLAVSGFDAIFNATNWNVTTTHTRTGTLNTNIRLGIADPNDAVLAGPINNPANNSDYYLLVRGLNFNLAESIGVLLGGHLASIQDADENEFVRAQVLGFDATDRRGWIGFTDVASEGNFVWTDGSPVTYTNWGGGEPNNANNTEHYAELLGSNGLWNDISLAGVSGGGNWAVVEVPGTGGPQFCDADWCQDGSKSVADIFCFLADWFALDPDARTYGGAATPVQAIFAWLAVWFATPNGPCTP